MGLEHIYHVDQTYSLDFVYFNSADNNHRRTRNLYCQPSNGISAILRFSEVLNLPMESRSCFFRFCNFVVDALQEGEKTKTKTSRFLIERGAFAPLFLNGIWLNTIVAKYSYLADGTKLSAVNADDCGFAYRGSFTYRADAGGDRVFESTPFGGGRIVATAGNDTEIRYFLTDHLESVRVVATDQNNLLERNDYQPFGKRWVTPSMPVSDNRDRFNGKEDQSFAGLPFSDYGARMYDRERGRWLSQDPLQQYHSPYVFCGNNPIRLIDLDGMEARDSTSVMIPPVIVYPSEDGEGGGHSNSFWWSLIPGYSLYEAYEAFSDGEYKSGFKNGLYGTIDIGLCFIPVSKLSNLYKVGKNLKKATSISRILPQFSNSTIERAVQKMMRNKDKIDFHIFVPKHKLENVVNTLGGKENTIRQALIELNGKLPVSGKFEATIELGGSQVTVRGYVVDGLPDIGTMFVPK